MILIKDPLDVPEAVCLLSGGMDSATVLYRMKRFASNITALHIAYGQPNLAHEQAAAGRIAHSAHVQLHRLQVQPIQAIHRADGAYWFPLRNLVLLTQAVMFCIREHIFPFIGLGIHATDSPYPDCTPEFLYSARTTLTEAASTPVILYVPYLEKLKSDIAKDATALGVPVDITWSCYTPRPDGGPCGECLACRTRQAALAKQ